VQPGTYQLIVNGMMTCQSCPPNRLCPSYGVDSLDVLNPTDNRYVCPDAYVCLGGAIDVSLNDGVTVRLCNPGYFCNMSGGFAPEEPCPINYYNNVPGQTACDPCPKGFYCNKLANTTPTPCPTGHFCPTYDPTDPIIQSSG
jgi:hypothetical protein